jgi:hypothetical protein
MRGYYCAGPCVLKVSVIIKLHHALVSLSVYVMQVLMNNGASW